MEGTGYIYYTMKIKNNIELQNENDQIWILIQSKDN